MSEENRQYAEDRQNFADGSPLQITLREMHRLAVNPRFWIGFALAIVLLTATGPFGTLVTMGIAERLFYWIVTTTTTFAAGLFCSILVSVILTDAGLPEWLARLVAGAVAGLPIGLIVWLINAADGDPGGLAELVRLTSYCLVVSMIISLFYYLIEVNTRQAAQNANTPSPSRDTPSAPIHAPAKGTASTGTTPPAPPFFDRMPPSLGRDIVSLQAQDHYILGRKVALLIEREAERELEGVEGMRSHRSWWVARAHVGELKRENDKLFAILSNGEQVPVSRTNAARIRSWFGR